MIAVANKQLTCQALRANCHSKVACYQVLKQEDNSAETARMCEIVNGCSPADTAQAQCRELVPRPVRRTPVFPGGMTAAVRYLPPEKLSPTPRNQHHIVDVSCNQLKLSDIAELGSSM